MNETRNRKLARTEGVISTVGGPQGSPWTGPDQKEGEGNGQLLEELSPLSFLLAACHTGKESTKTFA